MLSFKRNFPSYYLLAFFILVFAFYQAYQWRWICDDAYISFVYARNFWEGSGFVFNLGERVEGYTNFLWTLFLSISYGLGFKPQLVSVSSGIFFYLCLLVLYFFAENKLTFGKIYPLLVVHLALLFHLYIFASSGLETSTFTFLISLGLLFWERGNKYTFFVFLLASLTRPEGALFLVMASVDWIRKKQYKQPLFFGFLFILFLGIRYLYYQDFLPNTFYAKGNKGSYLSQGFYYFFYLIRSYPLYPSVLFLSGIQIYNSVKKNIELRLLFSTIFIYIFYVFYVGGDFMGNRFWIPILPYISYLAFRQLLFWENESQILSNQKYLFYRLYSKNSILLSLVFVLSTAIYSDPLKLTGTRIADWHGIVEERMFYDKHLIDVSGYDEGALEGFRVAFFGAQAHFIYFLKPSFAFEAESGLTDRLFARKQIKVRGRIGHETHLTYEDLDERQINILLDNRLPELELPYITYTWRTIPIRFYIWNYDPKKMESLCRRKDWNCDDLYSRFAKENWSLHTTKYLGKIQNR
ncbi:hypothetical protein AB3N60_11810 [Leptospira sp. WS39.C2]